MPARDLPAATRWLSALIVAPTEAACRRFDLSRLALAVDHGVAPLVGHRLSTRGLLVHVPEAVRGRVTQIVREAVVLDAVARHEQARMTSAFERAGVAALVFKGAAVSATHYHESWLRPRGDVDVLVSTTQVDAATGALESIGYRRALQPGGALVAHQARFCAPGTAGDFACDLHWRVADPFAFADAFPFDELWSASVEGDAPHVRHAAQVDALLISCVHRAAHHHDTDRLLLLYDIDRIARRFSSGDWERFTTLAAVRGLRAVSRRGLDLATALFDTPVPRQTRMSLTVDQQEASARFVAGGLRRIDILRSDLARLRTWRDRICLLREHVLPTPAYMAARYGCGRRIMLPWCYATRLARGAVRWFRPFAPHTTAARLP